MSTRHATMQPGCANDIALPRCTSLLAETCGPNSILSNYTANSQDEAPTAPVHRSNRRR